MPAVFVISQDWALRAGVRAELLHSGVEALGLDSLDNLSGAIAGGTAPSVVVLDAEMIGREFQTALANLAGRVPVIVVTPRTVRTARLEGAAVVLYRPVSIGEIVSRVKELLLGRTV